MMLTIRIFLTFVLTFVIAISAATTHAQSAGWKSWLREGSVNSPIQAVPDEAAALAPVTELQIEPHGAKKTAIVGSWLGVLSNGFRVVQSYAADGVIIVSIQGEVSVDPQLGTLTPTHGAWTYLGGRQFAVTMAGILYDVTTGGFQGLVKIRVLLTLSEDGDHLSGTDKVEIFDADGNPVFSLPPNSLQLTRIKAEPFN